MKFLLALAALVGSAVAQSCSSKFDFSRKGKKYLILFFIFY